jgi:hypothetical protein
MNKPALIKTLEQRFSIAFSHEEATDPAVFSRYGRKEVDACRYWLRAGEIVGLCARASGINSLDWLSSPALEKLEVLLLGENTFTDITIPANWTNFQHLDLNASPNLISVGFAGELCPLTRLEITDCPALTDLDIPDDCPKLHYFDVNRCKLKRLKLDGDFSSLVYLDASHNPDLKRASIAGNFASLLSLHLRAAALEKLSLTADFPILDTLDVAENTSQELVLPAHLILPKKLLRLYAKGCAPKNCPAVFLQSDGNAVDQARSWFQALEAGSEKNRIVKLLINGNGNVGKSTLWCALKNLKESACTCDDHQTTHGIELTVEALSLENVDFRGWDFGGQEVYQGTHRLFLTDGAVQVLVLDYVSEEAARTGESVPDRSNGTAEEPAKLVRNLALQHFYKRQKALGLSSKFIIVQTKKSAGHDRHPAALLLEREEKLAYEYLDAKKTKGVRGLREDLQDVARELPIHGMQFPNSWLKARQWIASNLKANKTAQEPLRVISKVDFRTKVVKEFAVIDDEKMIDALLTFLHAAGDVYVNKEHLKDRIIIDLSWALEGIYRPLQRGDFQRRAANNKGKLFVDDIYPHTTGAERNLLLEFMESCGMCFPADLETERDRNSEYYIFPAFLPEQADLLVRRSWEKLPATPSWSAVLPYRDLPAIHALICDLGRKTTEGQLWAEGIDLLLTDTREREGEKKLLPEARCRIELVGGSDNDAAFCQLVVTFENQEATAWFSSVQKWIGEHFSNLEWNSYNTAQTQVQAEVLESRVGSTVPLDVLPDKIGTESVAVWFVAHPLGEKKLSFHEELGRVKSRMSALGGIARIEPAINATVESLKDRSKRYKPRLIHFIGHGTANDVLVFHEENGPGKVEVSANKFRRNIEVIKRYATDLEVILLNACFSSDFAQEVSRENIYVIGTKDSLKNEVAITFAADFYGSFCQKNVSVIDAFIAGAETVYTEHCQSCEDYRLYYNGGDITPTLQYGK